MKKTIRNLFLIGFFFFALAFGSCSAGVEYDRKNKLYPESNWVSYDLAIGTVYGKRWERIGNVLFLFGVAIGIISSIIWYREKQGKDKSILELIEDK